MGKELKDMGFSELINEAMLDVFDTMLKKGISECRGALSRWMGIAINWRREKDKVEAANKIPEETKIKKRSGTIYILVIPGDYSSASVEVFKDKGDAEMAQRDIADNSERSYSFIHEAAL